MTGTMNTILTSLLSLAVGAISQQILLSEEQARNIGDNVQSWKFNFTSQAPHIFSSVHGLLQEWPNTFFPNGHNIVPCEIPTYTSLYHGRRDAGLPPSPEWFGFDVEMSYGIMGSDRNSHLLTYQTTRPVGCLYFDGESATLMGTGQMDTLMLFIYGNLTGPPAHDRWRGLFDEYARATNICQWVRDRGLGGLGWGVEGIVRMNAGFEMIWCNFTSPSIRLMTKLNVTAPLLPEAGEEKGRYHGVSAESPIESTSEGNDGPSKSYYPLPTQTQIPDPSTNPPNPPMPPNWRQSGREPFLASQTWGWFESATWHYGSSAMGPGRGETRVKPMTCGFLSFYSPIFTEQHLARSAIEGKELNLTTDGYWLGPGDDGVREQSLKQLMIRRRTHVLHNISQSDAVSMNLAAERVLKSLRYDDSSGINGRAKPDCSGMDWSTVTSEIVQRYGVRLRHLASVLTSGTGVNVTNDTALREWTVRIRHNTHTLLVPYLEYPYHPENVDDNVWSVSSSLGQEILSRCQFHYTRLLAPDQKSSLNPEESILKWAVEETLGNICQVIVDVGLGIEREWFHRFNGNKTDVSIPDKNGNKNLSNHSINSEIVRWKEEVEELMAWLGWADQWTGCENKCRWDETCFIPMWPFTWFRSQRPSSRDDSVTDDYDLPWANKDGSWHQSTESRPPGRGRPGYGPPGSGYGGRPLRPGRPGRPPPFFQDDSRLWEPTCVKAEYME